MALGLRDWPRSLFVRAFSAAEIRQRQSGHRRREPREARIRSFAAGRTSSCYCRGIIISFKTKTVFRAAAETVKIASRRILLSNKKTDIKGAGPGAREPKGKARGKAWRRKEVLGLADVRTDRSPSQIYPAGRFSFCGRSVDSFFSSVCTFTEGILMAGRTHYSSSVPLSVRPLFVHT